MKSLYLSFYQILIFYTLKRICFLQLINLYKIILSENYRVDFQPYPVEKPWVRPQEVWKKPPGNMEGLTSYKKEFIGKFFTLNIVNM